MFTWRNDVTCFCSYSLVLEVCCGSHGTWYGAWTVVGVENRRASFVVVWFCSLCCRSNGGHLRGFYSTGMGLGIQVLIRLGSIFWPSRAKHAKRETPPDFGGGGAHFVQSRLVDHFWVRGKRLKADVCVKKSYKYDPPTP